MLAVSEKEWTHHGLLLLSGLHQIGEWSSHERFKKEQIAEGRIDEVKVSEHAFFVACACLRVQGDMKHVGIPTASHPFGC